MTHDVFISYSTKDKNIANAVCSILEQNKIRCWIAPRDILPGVDYAEGIIDGISACKVVVLIFSQNSNASNHVKREIERAANYEKILIPFRIENVIPTKAMEYWLSTPHWIDALTVPMEKYMFKLAETIKLLISPYSSNSATTSEAQLKAKQLEEEKKLDNEAWERARKENTILSYKRYIDGTTIKEHLEYAKIKLNDLAEEKKRNELKIEDEKAWNRAVKINTVSSYGEYLLSNNTRHEKDASEMIKTFKLAEQGDEDSQIKIVNMHFLSEGLILDKEIALLYYRGIIKKEDKKVITIENDSMKKNNDGIPEVLIFIRAMKGYPKDQYLLADMYYYGKVVKKDKVKAAEWYRKAAEQNYVEAQTILAKMYYNGDGIKVDKVKAVEWYRKAAEQGNAIAQNDLGLMYSKGEVVEEDKVKAFEWYFKAAEQGLSAAQYNLGVMYWNGKGIKVDKVKAAEWYSKAAEQGYASAQYNLGVMYANGEGIKVDKVKAAEWYSKAAEQGNAVAQNNLGLMYDNGEGIKVDKVKAVEWYSKAAEQGNAKAQCNLGAMYEKGEGVAENREKAIEWYEKSAKAGNKKAMAKYRKLMFGTEKYIFKFTVIPLFIESTTRILSTFGIGKELLDGKILLYNCLFPVFLINILFIRRHFLNEKYRPFALSKYHGVSSMAFCSYCYYAFSIVKLLIYFFGIYNKFSSIYWVNVLVCILIGVSICLIAFVYGYVLVILSVKENNEIDCNKWKLM